MSAQPSTKKQRVVVKTTTTSNQKMQKKNQKKSQKKPKVSSKTTVQIPKSAVYQKERFYLSECAGLYLKALLDPFNVEAGQACIPDLNDLPSRKTLVITRGTFAAGTQGVGFVLLNPLLASNDANGIRLTSSSYAGTGVTVSIPTTGLSQTTVPQMPYTQSQLTGTNGVLARTVGCGIRIRYLGTELDRSGRLIPWRSNNVGAGLPSATTSLGSFLSQPQVPSIACTRRWHSVTYLPTSALCLAVNRDCYSYSDNTTDTVLSGDGTRFDLGFVVDGCKAGNAFEYEIYWHKEYISSDGTLVPNGISASHSDLPGLSAIRNAVEGQLGVGDGPELYKRVLDFMSKWSPQDISHVGTYASALGGAAKQLGWL